MASNSQNGKTAQPATIYEFARAAIQQRNAEIARRLAAGETLEAVGIDFGIHRERVRQIGMAAGVKATHKAKRIAARRARVAELMAAGKTNRAIAIEAGVSIPTVENDLAYLGLVRERTIKEHRLKAVAMMLTTTKCLAEIGRECGICPAQLANTKRRLLRLGFKCR